MTYCWTRSCLRPYSDVEHIPGPQRCSMYFAMSPADLARIHAIPWRNKKKYFKIDDLSFFCSTCQRTQPRRHFCDPILKQPKDPDYVDAVYDRILSPGRCRTCNKNEDHQETLFPCRKCNRMLPSAKYDYYQYTDRLKREYSCIDCDARKRKQNLSHLLVGSARKHFLAETMMGHRGNIA